MNYLSLTHRRVFTYSPTAFNLQVRVPKWHIRHGMGGCDAIGGCTPENMVCRAVIKAFWIPFFFLETGAY